MKIRSSYIQKKKQSKEKISMLTAYEYIFAKILDEAGIDIILVGDSLGNVFSGYKNTLPVTLEHMIYHSQAVSKGVEKAMILADMPFLTAQLSVLETQKNAGRLVQEGGAEAVKIEIGSLCDLQHVRAVSNMGIPVMGHLGLTPQRVHQLGYAIQGQSEEGASQLLELAKNAETAGCFGIVLECIPPHLAEHITVSIGIPTIGIGSGLHCDGQVLVTQDLLGLSPKIPSFVNPYASFYAETLKIISKFKQEVGGNASAI